MSKELPDKKEITFDQIREALKSGINKSETFLLLQDWTKQEENKVTTSEGHINLDRKRAHLYFDAGYIGEAYNSFEAALEQAWNEQKIELYNEIVVEMDKMEDK